METPIVLLHGLGSNTLTLKPLEIFLNYMGWKNTYTPYYPVDKMTFEETMNYVDELLSKKYQNDKELILIGQSMGGVVSNNLHKKGWKIKGAVYIGSPLHGAELLNQLEKILPTKVKDLLNKKPYEYLKTKEIKNKVPPHPYRTISMGWACSDFDGCVYKNEAMLEEEYNTHLAWADHRTIFANPRLFLHVNGLLCEMIGNKK